MPRSLTPQKVKSGNPDFGQILRMPKRFLRRPWSCFSALVRWPSQDGPTMWYYMELFKWLNTFHSCTFVCHWASDIEQRWCRLDGSWQQDASSLPLDGVEANESLERKTRTQRLRAGQPHAGCSAGDKKCLGKNVVSQMDVALLGADVGVSRKGRPGKPKATIVFLVFRITRGCLRA